MNLPINYTILDRTATLSFDRRHIFNMLPRSLIPREYASYWMQFGMIIYSQGTTRKVGWNIETLFVSRIQHPGWLSERCRKSTQNVTLSLLNRIEATLRCSRNKYGTRLSARNYRDHLLIIALIIIALIEIREIFKQNSPLFLNYRIRSFVSQIFYPLYLMFPNISSKLWLNFIIAN